MNYEHGYPHTHLCNGITRMIRWAGRGAEAVALVESWLLTLNFLPLEWGLMYKLPPTLAACAVAQWAETVLVQIPHSVLADTCSRRLEVSLCCYLSHTCALPITSLSSFILLNLIGGCGCIIVMQPASQWRCMSFAHSHHDEQCSMSTSHLAFYTCMSVYRQF